MKNNPLINYAAFAKQKRELTDYNITIKNPNIFSEVIESTPHTFNCDLSFFEEKNHTCIKYEIKSTLKLICQNSLGVFDYDFNVTNTIILVADDRWAKDSQFEPFICTDPIIDLREIIKEEILLDLPLVPKNDTSTCKNQKKRSYYDEQEIVSEEKKNPFEILNKLK